MVEDWLFRFSILKYREQCRKRESITRNIMVWLLLVLFILSGEKINQ
jgi:hypothetical protein